MVDITAYGADDYLIPNPAHRYSVSETDIARIMQDREQDEMPYVEAAQRCADAIFDPGLPPVGLAIATAKLTPSSPETHNVAVQRRDRPGIDGRERSNG